MQTGRRIQERGSGVCGRVTPRQRAGGSVSPGESAETDTRTREQLQESEEGGTACQRGAQGGTCSASSLSMGRRKPNRRSHRHTRGRSWQRPRDGTKPSLQKRELSRGGEDARGAYWYSLQLILVDTSFLPLTAEREANRWVRVGVGVGGIFDCHQNTDPTSPVSHSCTARASLIATLFRKSEVIQKRGRKIKRN